jgi:integrase/predicted nucleotidyltransferase
VATIRQRRPGVWEVRVFTGDDEQGRPTQTSTTVRGAKRDAQRVAAELERRPSNTGGRTVAELLDAWLDVNEGHWSATTKRDERGRAQRIVEDPLGKKSLAKLGVADVERWHARLRKRGVGEAAIRNRHNTLRAALGQAERWGWVPNNVASLARLRAPKKAPRGSMTHEDVTAVLAAARVIDPAAELALRLAAVGGLRRSEIAALRWDDVVDGRLVVDSAVEVVRFDDGRSTIRRDAPSKTANRRALALDAATLAMIDAQRAEREIAGPWMFGLDTEPPNPDRIGWWWSRARSMSGIDSRWRLHDLRHWTATASIRAGTDVRTVAGRLGHANPAMTLRVYAHAVEEADREVADHLGNILSREDVDLERGVAQPVGQSTRMDVLSRFEVDAETIADFCRRNGIRRLSVFGSALRDDFTPESDIDLLVEFEPDQAVSLLDMSRMERELEAVIPNRRVDLRTAGDLGRRFRDRVIAEAQAVYDAAA